MKDFMRQLLAKKMQAKAIKKLSNRGFALVDLLVGAALTTTVVAAAGYGLSSMIGASNASNARTEGRVEMNRSLDFISSELRESSSIIKDVDASTTVVPSAFEASYSGRGIVIDTTVKKVLMINTTATGNTPIIYFVAKPVSGLWKGPRVLYRWGPKYNSNGNYDNAGTPADWVSEALVDKIQDGGGATPTCAGGGTLNGDSGFYSCVDAAGKTAQIFQKGKITKVLGASETFSMSMNTGTRKTTATIAPSTIATGATAFAVGTPSPSPSSSPSPSTPPSTSTFNLTSGGVTVSQDSTMTVKTLNAQYPWQVYGTIYFPTGQAKISGTTTTVGSSGTPLLVNYKSGTVNFDTSANNTKTFDVTKNTTLSIKGCSNTGSVGCATSTTAADQGLTVYTLKNGDPSPVVAGWGSQASAKTVLQDAGLLDASNNIVLPSNQVIYLYELYTKNRSNSAYDLQDILVLATITPNGKCNNGVGNGSDGCTPGNSTAKDEKLYNISTGKLVCTPATGNPCKETATKVPAFKLPAGVTPKV
jgi:hypothetical protein